MNLTKMALFCYILIIINLSYLNQSISLGSSQNSNYDIYNLGILDTVTSDETTYTRFVALKIIRDYSIVNLTVKNNGEPLDSITVQIKVENDIVINTFATKEKTTLVETLSYQFEFSQNLYVILDNLSSKDLTLEISIIIDPVIDWRESDISLSIIGSELICFDSSEMPENEYSEFLFLPKKQMFHLTPTKYTFLRKKLVVKGLLFIDIPDGMVLDCNLAVVLDQIKISSISLNEKNYYFDSQNNVNFNFTLNRNSLSKVYSISIVINPDYDSLGSETDAHVKFGIKGRFLKAESRTLLDSKHPIPEWLMLPILVFTL
ncbi:MAG: hypothetical protein ACTSR2_07565, partial [Candidatus Hodarchaeales archaeon]